MSDQKQMTTEGVSASLAAALGVDTHGNRELIKMVIRRSITEAREACAKLAETLEYYEAERGSISAAIRSNTDVERISANPPEQPRTDVNENGNR